MECSVVLKVCVNCVYYELSKSQPYRYFECLNDSNRSTMARKYETSQNCPSLVLLPGAKEVIPCVTCGRVATWAQMMKNPDRKDRPLACAKCQEHVDWEVNVYSIDDLSDDDRKKLLTMEPLQLEQMKKKNIQNSYKRNGISLPSGERNTYDFILKHGPALTIASLPQKYKGALGNLERKGLIELSYITKEYMDLKRHISKNLKLKVCSLV